LLYLIPRTQAKRRISNQISGIFHNNPGSFRIIWGDTEKKETVVPTGRSSNFLKDDLILLADFDHWCGNFASYLYDLAGRPAQDRNRILAAENNLSMEYWVIENVGRTYDSNIWFAAIYFWYINY